MTKNEIKLEQIVYVNFIKHSWTWEKLTTDERAIISEILRNCTLYGKDKRQLRECLYSIYEAFLKVLECNEGSWRSSSKNEIPTF